MDDWSVMELRVYLCVESERFGAPFWEGLYQKQSLFAMQDNKQKRTSFKLVYKCKV